MRPVTVFVLLLFASGVVGGELYGRTLAAQRLAQVPVGYVGYRVAACPAGGMAPATAPVGECSGATRTPRAPRTRHRRTVGRGLLPALRAGPVA